MASVLEAIRSQYPIYDGVSDQAMLSDIRENYYPELSVEQVGQKFGYQPPQIEQPVEEDKPWTNDALAIGHQIAGGAMVDFNKQVGQAAQAFTDDDSAVSEWGKGVVDRANARAKDYEPDFQGRGLIAETLMKGGRALPSSAATMAATVANPVLGAVAATALYGGSQYQETIEKFDDPNGDEAHRAGLTTGAIQGGLETVSNIVGAKLFGGGVLTKTIDGLLGKATDSAVLKPFAKAMATSVPTEMATEAAQDVGTELVERDYGVGSGNDLWETAKDSMQGALGMSMFLGGGSLAYHYQKGKQAEAIDTLISSPNSGTKEERQAVIDMLYKDAKRLKINEADAWHQIASNEVANEQPISRSIQPVVTDVTDATSVDEAIQTANNILSPDPRTLALRQYALDGDLAKLNNKPATEPNTDSTWETPWAKGTSRAEAIKRQATIEGLPIQQAIDNQYQLGGYIPGEAGQVWEAPNTEQANKQHQINKAFYEREQADLQAKANALDALILNPDTPTDQVKQYRKARAKLETERRQRADEFRNGLGFNIVPNTSGEAKNTQLADKLSGLLQQATQPTGEPSWQKEKEKAAAVKSADLPSVNTESSTEVAPTFEPTHTLFGESVRQIAPNLYVNSRNIEFEDNDNQAEVINADSNATIDATNNPTAASQDSGVGSGVRGTASDIATPDTGLDDRGIGGNDTRIPDAVQQPASDSEPGRALDSKKMSTFPPILRLDKDKYLEHEAKKFRRQNKNATQAAVDNHINGLNRTYEDDFIAQAAKLSQEDHAYVNGLQNLRKEAQISAYNEDRKLAGLPEYEQSQDKATQTTTQEVNVNDTLGAEKADSEMQDDKGVSVAQEQPAQTPATEEALDETTDNQTQPVSPDTTADTSGNEKAARGSEKQPDVLIEEVKKIKSPIQDNATQNETVSDSNQTENSGSIQDNEKTREDYLSDPDFVKFLKKDKVMVNDISVTADKALKNLDNKIAMFKGFIDCMG